MATRATNPMPLLCGNRNEEEELNQFAGYLKGGILEATIREQATVCAYCLEDFTERRNKVRCETCGQLFHTLRNRPRRLEWPCPPRAEVSGCHPTPQVRPNEIRAKDPPVGRTKTRRRRCCGCRCGCWRRPGRLVSCMRCGAEVGPGCCLAAESMLRRGRGLCHVCYDG